MNINPRTEPGFISKYSIFLFMILVILLGGGTVFLVVKGIIPAGLALASALSASIAGIDQNNLNNYWGYGSILILIAVLFVFTTDPFNLSRNHNRIEHLPTPGHEQSGD